MVLTLAGFAQEGGYIYIETSPSRPFYIRTADSILLSRAGNYLVLAPLKPWLGDIIVGFQGEVQAAFVFNLKDSSEERGLVLKDMQAEGWRLFDWQRNEMMNTRRLGRDEQYYARLQKRQDAFALRLAAVMGDSSILYYDPAVDKSVAAGKKKTGAPATAAPAAPGSAVPVVSQPVPPVASPSAASVSKGGSDSSGRFRASPVSQVRRLFKTDLGGSWKLIYEVNGPEGRDTVEVNILKDKLAPLKRKRS